MFSPFVKTFTCSLTLPCSSTMRSRTFGARFPSALSTSLTVEQGSSIVTTDFPLTVNPSAFGSSMVITLSS